MELNKQEISALEEKMRHPEKEVICPRCGAKLEAKIFRTAAHIKCPTPGCIEDKIRGI